MTSFWDSNIWSLLLLGGMLFASMLIAHILKKNITFLPKIIDSCISFRRNYNFDIYNYL